jgi:DNA-binding response OmpR family regulator
MQLFGWLAGEEIPVEYDLRHHGWHLVELGASPGQVSLPLLLNDLSVANRLSSRRERAPITLIGVEDPVLRASLLAEGFGEVLPAAVALVELEKRVGRVALALDALPRRRAHGRLELDLMVRDGWVGARRIGLHPREFALLWRLAETPGEPVESDALLSEVWQMNFRPETNSLAVHVCRLRAKLAVAGLSQIVRTTPVGGYVLAPDPSAPAIPLHANNSGLDAHVLAVAPLHVDTAEEA